MPSPQTHRAPQGNFHKFSWIAAARIEEYDGKIDKARDLIARGLELCGKNEDIWLEAARLEKPEK